MIRLGILGSTRGSNLQAIIDAIAKDNLSAKIAVVISNKTDSGILEKARTKNLTAKFVDATGLERSVFDEKVSILLREHNVDLVVLIGYMRILSREFVLAWQNRIINVHPSLLPDFAGLMDMTVHDAVLASGKTETGCTVHYVTEEVDAGPIILQRKCEVFAKDTREVLKQRVQALEGLALVEAIKTIILPINLK